MKRKRTAALFALYCAGMLLLLFGMRLGTRGEMRWNLQPLDTVCRFLWVLRYSPDPEQRLVAFANLAGNVVLFVPLGGWLPVLFAPMRRWYGALSTILLVLMGVELLQLLTALGACDVDDLLLNFLGAWGGWLLWRTGRRAAEIGT